MHTSCTAEHAMVGQRETFRRRLLSSSVLIDYELVRYDFIFFPLRSNKVANRPAADVHRVCSFYLAQSRLLSAESAAVAVHSGLDETGGGIPVEGNVVVQGVMEVNSMCRDCSNR